MTRPLFITGTARGGTTFITRLLSVNDNIKIASDTFLPIFRSLRTKILREFADPNFNSELPLSDYYYSAEQIRFLNIIQEADLNLTLSPSEFETVCSHVSERMKLTEKNCMPYLSLLRGSTYYELIRSGISLIEKTFNASNALWCGFKDLWIIEFYTLLAKSFPEAKFMIIVRDPRGAIASILKSREEFPQKVPLLYSYARSWRKHVAFSRFFMTNASLKDRLMVFRYEDFVNSPECKTQEICDFLGFEYDASMLNVNNFRPISGDSWKGFSHFKISGEGIYTDAIELWKSYLDKGTIEFIEFVCEPEMKLFNYMPEVYHDGFSSDEVMRILRKDDQVCQGWRGIHLDWDIELSNELFRKQAIKLSKEVLTHEMITKYFLFEDIYDELKMAHGSCLPMAAKGRSAQG